MTYEQKLDYLNLYRQSVARAQELAEDLADLEAQSQRTTPLLTGMPGGGATDRLAAIEARKEAKEQELEAQIKRLFLCRARTAAAIRAAPPPSRQVLSLLYLQCRSVSQAAALLGKSKRQIYHLHRTGVSALSL